MDSRHEASERKQFPAQAVHLVGLIRRLFEGRHGAATIAEAPLPEPAPTAPNIEIGTADSLRTLAASAPGRRQHEQGASRDQAALEDKRRIKELLQTHLQDAMWNELLSHIQPAAERGDQEFQLLRFPSDLCDDGGRKIRIGDEDWQDTLRGEAAELAARWRRDLQPKGIGLSARMLDYSNGMPGDIGLFVTWGG